MRDINNHTIIKLTKIEYYLEESNLIRVFALKHVTKELAIVKLMIKPINHERLLQSGIIIKMNEFCSN